MEDIRMHIAAKTLSLLNGAVLGTLEIYREGPDSDMIVSLEIEVVFRAKDPAGRTLPAFSQQLTRR